MPITEALKKLIKAITGKTAVGETIEELVTNLNDNYPEGGSGGDTYETVAEIAVGTMQSGGEEMPGLYIYSDSEAVAPALNENETYYLNAANNESNSVVIDIDTTTLRFNASTGEGLPTPLDTDKNMYVIQWAGNGLTLVSDTDAISNTTVKILKKVSGGGGTVTVDSELSETSENPVQNKVIAAALAAIAPFVCDVTVDTTESGFDITIKDTPESLNAAWAANREIIMPVANIRLKMTECNYTDAMNYRFKFFAENPDKSTGNMETYSLIYSSTLTATLDSKDYTPTT